MGLNVEIKNFYNAGLPAGETTIYVCPSDRKAIIKSIKLAETTGVDKTVNLYAIQGSSKVHLIPKDMTLLAGYSLDLDEAITLEGGESLNASGQVANAVTCKISGVEEIV